MTTYRGVNDPRYIAKMALINAIQKVPLEFQPRQAHKYPEDNHHEFERWFSDNTMAQELSGKPRTYLPVFWTAYWCNNGYGKKERGRNILQRFIDNLPRTKKYFTICQYDDGCLVDFKDLDIKIFGMSGGRIDYPIPLLCMPHKYEFPGIKKDIFCSFVGGDTHPIRKELVKQFTGKQGCYVTMKKHSLKDYCNILARSIFALCPRGYGKSSFRIAEAIQYGAIPVYISDEFVKPYNMDLPINIQVIGNSLPGLRESLRSLDNPYLRKQIESLKLLFTYEGCKQKILENI
jgi:hypothetical protein